MPWGSCNCCESDAGASDFNVPNRIENAVQPKDSAEPPSMAVNQPKAVEKCAVGFKSIVVAKEATEESIVPNSMWSEARKGETAATAEQAKDQQSTKVEDRAGQPAEQMATNSPGADDSKFFDWTVTLQKEGDENETLGLSLTLFHSRLAVVVEVLDYGLVNKYNTQPNLEADRRVVPNDVIVAVNGIQNDTAEMFNAFKVTDAPVLTMRRVFQFEACVRRSEVPHGLQLRDGGAEVVQVGQGSIKEYNKGCETGFQVVPGDMILAVNGKKEIRKELKELSDSADNGPDELRLLVKRSPSP